MADAEAKKTATDKGFYVVDPDRIGAGPPQEGNYSESKKSYYARKYMEAQSARSKLEATPIERDLDVWSIRTSHRAAHPSSPLSMLRPGRDNNLG